MLTNHGSESRFDCWWVLFPSVDRRLFSSHMASMAAHGVSIAMACRQLGVSEKELRAMLADGRLRYRQVNRGLGKRSHTIIDSDDIARVLFCAVGRRASMPPNTRMQSVFRAPKRSYDILHSWTGQDLSAKG